MSTIDTAKLRHLAVFAQVVESGSFAEAARKLKTSRSRVSEQVAQLEDALGVRLLQRSTRQLSVTEEGRKIYQQASVLPALLECVNDIASSKEPEGRVSLSLSNDMALTWVLPVLKGFREKYPDVQLNLILNDETSDLIAEDIDLAIRTSFQENSSLIARPLHKESVGIYASPEYLQQHEYPETTEDLENLDWVTLSQVSNDGSQKFLKEGRPFRLTPARYYSCNSPWMLQQMLISGLGVGCVLPSAVGREIESGMLVPVMPGLVSEPLTISLIYPSRQQVPLRTRCLIDYLLAADLFPLTGKS